MQTERSVGKYTIDDNNMNADDLIAMYNEKKRNSSGS